MADNPKGLRDHPTVSVVAPVFNEEAILEELYRRVRDVLDGAGEDWELVMVNDGSRDRSPEIMQQLHDQDPRVKVVYFARNFGHQVAISAGADYASGDAVVIIDADLQDPPEVIPDLLAKWRDGYEVVYAVRAKRMGETWFKEFTARAFYRIIYRITDINIPMDVGDFRLMDRKAVDALKGIREKHRFMRGLSVWIGFRQTGVEYVRAERFAGQTKYPFKNILLPAAPVGHLRRFRLRCPGCPGHHRHRDPAPLRQPGLLRPGDDPGQRAVPGRRAVDLPGDHRRVPRPYLRRGQGAAALHREQHPGVRHACRLTAKTCTRDLILATGSNVTQPKC
jgi:Glycosyl transferase family 2